MAKSLSRARSPKRETADYSIKLYGEARKEFIRSAFLRHWERVREAVDLIEDTGDIGIVTQSLRRMCKAIDPVLSRHYLEPYDLGDAGDWRNTDLEAALGLVGLESEFAEATESQLCPRAVRG